MIQLRQARYLQILHEPEIFLWEKYNNLVGAFRNQENEVVHHLFIIVHYFLWFIIVHYLLRENKNLPHEYLLGIRNIAMPYHNHSCYSCMEASTMFHRVNEIFRILKRRLLYHIRPYFNGISPYIALENRPWKNGRYLQSIGSCCMAMFQ